MDPTDMGHTLDVPDTPDRLTKRGISVRTSVKEGNNGSPVPSHGRLENFTGEGTKDMPMAIESGSRRLSLRPPRCASSSINSLHPLNSAAFSLASSSSSRNGIFRKGVTEKNLSCERDDSIHGRDQPRRACISNSSSQHDSLIDHSERNLHRYADRNGFPYGAAGKGGDYVRKKSGVAIGASSSHPQTNLSTTGKGIHDISKLGSSNNRGQGVEFVDNVQNKPSNGSFLSLGSVSSPRVNKQKRLVRNGCISPNNIAMAKHLAMKDNNSSVDAALVTTSASTEINSSPISVDIRELVAEDSDSRLGKGKAVISHPCSSKDSDFRNKNWQCRSSLSFNEKAMGTGDDTRDAGKGTEELGGWRSTRNRTRKMTLSSSDDEQFVNVEMDAPGCSNQHHENRMARRGKGISVAASTNQSDPRLTSSEHSHARALGGSVIHSGTRLGRSNGHGSAANTLIKRRKQGSTSRTFAECSTSLSDDPDVVFHGLSAEPSNAHSSSNEENLQTVIEVDEFSPQLRFNTHEEDERARQVEADERLARELQEQLYNEMPAFGNYEVDEDMSMGLHIVDDTSIGFSGERNPSSVSRGARVSNLRRQTQPRSSSNAPRRGSLTRASALGRMTRLRSRFPGQPRTILPSRGRTSLFPTDMDIDTRMHILGTLEAFSDLGVGPGAGILQTQRDFNENDYEMLLALDENNDHYGGASARQINGLPQSTVQSDNFEEPCAVCLETPTVGDTIRHLPCLHKFHKDCIDPWLRRKTSCPVCKSSVT